MAASPCLKAFMLPGGPLLPLTPPLPGMPAIVTLNPFHDHFRLFYQNDFRLFTLKTFAHLSDTSTKAKITPAVSAERYIYNKVFVSRDRITDKNSQACRAALADINIDERLICRLIVGLFHLLRGMGHRCHALPLTCTQFCRRRPC